ncbi:hypothetical protein, partial [Salinimicrobium sp. HB62]|uniref:hypothetical protein n=1 Tax=Salinimicrobium sp. HB62 TaxID=3077781 RepID=UPI002D79B572
SPFLKSFLCAGPSTAAQDKLRTRTLMEYYRKGFMKSGKEKKLSISEELSLCGPFDCRSG